MKPGWGCLSGGLAIGTIVICTIMAAMTGVVGAAATIVAPEHLALPREQLAVRRRHAEALLAEAHLSEHQQRKREK